MSVLIRYLLTEDQVRELHCACRNTRRESWPAYRHESRVNARTELRTKGLLNEKTDCVTQEGMQAYRAAVDAGWIF